MRKMTSYVAVMFVAIGLLILSSSKADAEAYTITDLGTLGGTRSEALSINALGQIGGISALANDTPRPFLYSRGSMVQLADVLSDSVHMNNLGQAVISSVDSNGMPQSYLWTPSVPNGTQGALTNIGDSLTTFAKANDINDAGIVVGNATSSALEHYAFIWQNGVITPVPVGFASRAAGINNAGQITGSFYAAGVDQGYLYDSMSGTLTNLGSLTQNGQVIPHAINSLGQVVGEATATDGHNHAFFYSDGMMKDLGTLPGGFQSQAFGINSLGQVVGYSPVSSPGYSSAFLYTHGEMLSLGQLISPNSGWVLDAAVDINDSGQIVGVGRNPHGFGAAFLLTPVPEPSTLTLTLISTLALLAKVRRIKNAPVEES